MIGLTFRDISEFSGVNPGVNIAIQLNFLVPLCLHHTNKENIPAKIISSLLYVMRGFNGTILCLMMFKLHQVKS